MKLYYLAHPVRGDAHYSEEENLEHALKVQKILYESGLPCINGWYTYVRIYPNMRAVDDVENFIRLDQQAVRTLGRIVLTGHRISAGMEREVFALNKHGGEVLDLTGIPDEKLPYYVQDHLAALQPHE